MSRFDSFVVLADMRTGSNFLEANLNALPGVACHGEAFNPHFIGHPNKTEILGITQEMRDRDPASLIAAIRAEAGVLGGFRFFHDHDTRVIDGLLADPRCAKVVLTRNPAESYVSLKIAKATGQWKLTNARKARSEVVSFDAAEFEAHLEHLQAFQLRILRALQISGQTAFYVDYEDIQDLEVMNGLAAYLGIAARLEGLDRKLKKQNPETIEEKVINFDEMAAVLARLDRFNLSRTPNFEPRRGGSIPNFLAAAHSPLMFQPVPGGAETAITGWLTALDGAAPKGGFNQKSLRQWKLARPGHRSFAVIRHPLARAHSVFCDRILSTGPASYAQIREHLQRQFGMILPGKHADWSDSDHAAALVVFLGFLRANLSGQTALRVDGTWATQSAVLQGMATAAMPDRILRETSNAEGLAEALTEIAREAGVTAPLPPLAGATDPHAERLARIWTPALESLAQEAYGRDYVGFGWGPWRGN